MKKKNSKRFRYRIVRTGRGTLRSKVLTMGSHMALAAFEHELRAVAGDAVRPFLCDGSPFGCDVFLVGINPATTVGLWDHWSIDRGCDKAGWLSEYDKVEGRRRSTRRMIERLRDALKPIRALETNVFHHNSRCAAELAKEDKRTEVFEFLLAKLTPRVLFVHGKLAIEHLKTLTGTQLVIGEFVPVRYLGNAFDAIADRHLSRGWSYAKIDQLGHRLRTRCESDQHLDSAERPQVVEGENRRLGDEL